MMKTEWLGLSFGCAVALAATHAAQAEGMRCMPRADALAYLGAEYQEERQVMGLDRRGVMEVFASAASGTWTVTITTPEGMTCLVAAGQFYDEAPAGITGAGTSGA
ncbi:hypothetical protein FHS89_003083 [Rubricella aquisinus]|uniref:Uncharacterized protein n=1 Tax=Rubricella aquisinus TaxID=2028108 RepID=A0A840WPS1_9RHOB|nr:hypothetical protein [Rubricella aquisinus]MBB5517039.1 hypothetical protein [Rubricella aquisinus]